jgi:WD40 repeat protein
VVCDAATGKVRARTTLPPFDFIPPLACVSFSPDGKLLAGGYASSIVVWDAASGNKVAAGNLVPAPVKSVTFSADGSVLFTVHEDEQLVRRWVAASCQSIPEPAGHTGQVRALSFTADGTRVVTVVGHDDGPAWPARGGAPIPGRKEDKERLTSEWLKSSGQTSLLLCDDDFWLYAYDVSYSRLKVVDECSGVKVGGDRVLTVTSKDDRATLAVHDGWSETILRAISVKDTWPPSGAVGALSPDGRTLIAADERALRVIDVDSGRERRFDPGADATSPAERSTSIKFSPDGRRLAVIGANGVVHVFSAEAGRLIREIKVPKPDSVPNHIGPVHAGCCAFSPDGKTLFTCRARNSSETKSCVPAYAWEVATGQKVRTYAVDRLLLSPDNRLVAGLEEGRIHLYELYSGATFRECKGDFELTGIPAFSPDGGLLAAGVVDTTVLMWDTGKSAGPRRAERLDPETLVRLWHDLAEADAPKAYAAIGRLIADPDRAIPFLGRRLRALPVVGAVWLQELIADLDSDAFQTRESASRKLAELGEFVEPALRAALQKEADSLERRRRLTDLLNAIDEQRHVLRPEQLAHVRAIQVLESVHNPECEHLLRSIAKGAYGAERTRDARDALSRLRSRAGK